MGQFQKATKAGYDFISAIPLGTTTDLLFSIDEVRQMNRLADEIEAEKQKEVNLCPICNERKIIPIMNFKVNETKVCGYCFAKISNSFYDFSDEEKESLAAMARLVEYVKEDESVGIKIDWVEENPLTKERGGWWHIEFYQYTSCRTISFAYRRTLPTAINAIEEDS